MKHLLQGAYDLHVHTAPDVVIRKYDDFEAAERYLAADMKGFVIKSHPFPTAARAKLVKKVYPDCNAIGSIVLNNSVGGINPVAVETAARMGAKYVWFPTMDSRNEALFQSSANQEKPYYMTETANVATADSIAVLKDGALTDGCEEVLSVIKQYDMILATGHISPEESLALLRRGKELGLTKMVATHPALPTTFADLEMQKAFVDCGAYIEHTYFIPYARKCSFEEIYAQIRAVGCEHVILVSDMGQSNNPDPVDGLLDFVTHLATDGKFTEDDIRRMIVLNPATLVE